ncbi:dTDP-4-dehydrorhamnose reductase [Vibrio cholerae]|uniref:dTDP-4-dehydrorhamnose reductase n=1 Tax=Vibrio cholerae TaxID=666 RepID=Q842P8_VIBCL|nr:dTDP-4-dehydrorhamnose reductase [Vibrio cholerae]AAO88940.1 dTDP-6-deoxy-L-mannose-dehydrogenase [Vibrio cholerae]ELH0900761.1 dTDP-4-dehydrorhamnose reductase [Vibrio cholerae]EMC3731273.1 dTDP-4-dehydrorhamnose reductase [Vibrio cholerae]QKU64124.1 dTDP-4-dehydrorhamnose reductase [Vibrio cholerae]QKU68007.1 dTDP-4-dehydrorhamnose reductase [Vibrio cholerae]
MFLVTGSNGLLGSEIRRILGSDKGIYTDRNELDVTDKNSIKKFLMSRKDIEVIINCAAGANAEYIEENSEWGRRITVDAPMYLAQEAKENGIKLIHISTDYVFDGDRNVPYIESDYTNGLSLYGRFKAEGEQAVLKNSDTCAIIRTAWLFSEQMKDFIGAMVRLSETRDSVNVVFDQVGSPTYVPDLASHIITIANNLNVGEKEIFHVTNEGVCSWYDIACQIMRELKIDCKVKPIRSSEYKTKAARPHYSVLDKKKVKERFSLEIRHYSDALSECLKNIHATR